MSAMTPTTTTRSERMTTYYKEIQITGGNTEVHPDDRHSHGKFAINVDLGSREVAVSFPDILGFQGKYLTFAADDWDAIVKAINETELQRGKVVSTTWNGQ
jgi:hypothetical protein